MLLRKKEEIENWLNQYQIKNYELIEDKEYGYIVNVNGTVNLWNKKLQSIDVKFNEVNGNFVCNDNKLKSLKGCPEIIKGYFDCSDNKLNTLKYGPKIVNQNFYSNYNNLTIEGLEYLPKKVKDNYIEITENKKLGNLTNIYEFKELKEKIDEILNIKKEKEKLLKNINK